MKDLKKHTKKSVLIVEDAESIIDDIVNQLITNYHCKFDAASDGEEALKLTENERFDLIITDLTLPKLDGISFIKELKKSKLNKMTPIIIISAYIDEKARNYISENKISDVLVKPIEDESLHILLSKYLDRL